jgi:hypothetical protein
MALELYYTSSPRGLRPGTSGLCTVAMTRSMSVALASRLESLCGYRPPGEDIPIERWPIALSHWTIDIGGVERHVLAAVRPVKPDHTMRSNTLAHFAVLHTSELDPAGAAWMLAQPETSASTWSGEPRHLDAERAVPRGGPAGARACTTWASVAGDAGWAGVLANAAMLDPAKPATVIYPMGTRALDLIAEAMSLLPAAYRWRVTFTTYFTQPIAGVRCTWRFCLDGTTAATAARQSGGLVIDAAAPHPCTRTGEFVDAARAGRAPVLAAPAVHAASTAKSASGRSAPAASGPIPIETDASHEGEHRRRIPARRPVGMDELSPTAARSGRTALAVAVVTSVSLLAIVAVLAVLMRTMSVEIVELQDRVTRAEEERDLFRAGGEEAEALKQERDGLLKQLSGVRDEVKTLGDERDKLRTGNEQLKAKLSVLSPADDASRPASTPPAPSADPTSPAPASPTPSPVPPPVEDVRSSESGTSVAEGPSVAQGEASRAQPQSGGAPSPMTRRKDDVLRPHVQGLTTPSGAHGYAAESTIEAPSAPPVAAGAQKEAPVTVRWPALAGCTGATPSLTASSAIESIGFTVTAQATLSIDDGGSRSEVARASLNDSGIEWTWLASGATRAFDVLKDREMKSPESWAMITSQIRCDAQCADGSSRHAWLGKPRVRKWEASGNGRDRFDVNIPAALVGNAEIEWGGQWVSPADGGSAESVAGAVTARRTGTASKGMSAISIAWTPAEGGREALAAVDRFQAEVAEERKLAELQRIVTQLLDSRDVPARAVAPSGQEIALATAGYNDWRAQADKDLSEAQRTTFNNQPHAKKLVEYRNWLRDSKIESLRQELATTKAVCDAAMQSWREAVDGVTIVVRLCADGPPVELVELSVASKDLSLPWTRGAPAGRPGP